MFECVHALTDAQTSARVPSYKLTLWAFGSGELKSGDTIFPIISLWGYLLDAQGQLTPYWVDRSGRNSNSSIILCMSLLPASLKRIRSISTEIKWWLQFFRRSRAANSVVSGWIWMKSTHPSFYVCPRYLQVWKWSDQKQLRKRDDVVFPIIRLWDFFLTLKAANSVVGGPIWRKFKLIQDIMHGLITYKFEKERTNSNREKVVTSII